MLGGTLYTLKELSELFGVHRTTVMRTIERNRKALSPYIRKGLRPMRISRAGAGELARIMGFEPEEVLRNDDFSNDPAVEESPDFSVRPQKEPEFFQSRSGQRNLRPLVSARIQKVPGMDHGTAVRNLMSHDTGQMPPISRTNAALWQTSGSSALAPAEIPAMPRPLPVTLPLAVVETPSPVETAPIHGNYAPCKDGALPVDSGNTIDHGNTLDHGIALDHGNTVEGSATENGETRRGVFSSLAGKIRNFWQRIWFGRSHRREELLDYCEKYHDSAHLEGMAGSLFNKLLVKCSDDEIFAYSIERKILPKYLEFMEIMGQQKVVTEELARVNGTARRMMELQYQGFTVMIEALREGSSDLYSIASSKIERANTVRMEFLSSLKTLADRYVD